MADPVTAAAIAGSSLLSASSAIAEGKAQFASARFNQQVAERNAKLAEQESQLILNQSEYAINQFRKQFDFLKSSAGNALRYNGFEASSGTGLKVQLAMAKEADVEISKRRYNANVESQRALNQAEELRLQGQMGMAMGRAARSASRVAAASSLLSGAAKMSSILSPSPSAQPSTSAFSSGETSAPTFTGSTGIPFGPAEGYTGG